jgi:hypothetical protein
MKAAASRNPGDAREDASFFAARAVPPAQCGWLLEIISTDRNWQQVLL